MNYDAALRKFASSARQKNRRKTDDDDGDDENVRTHWSTLHPDCSQDIINLIHNDKMAVTCREKILSHITTKNINICTQDGHAIIWEDDFANRFQHRYKDFVRNAYVAHLVYGVVPVVLISDKTGHLYPAVPVLNTYLIQCSFAVETESYSYRVIRPTKYLSKPQDLDGTYKTDGSTKGVTNGADLIRLLNQGSGFAGLNLRGDKDAYKNPAYSSAGNEGWFIDHSLKVFDIFGCAHGPCGEIYSPLISIMEQYYVNQYCMDTMFRAQEKMLRPTHLVEEKPKTNLDIHTENGSGPGSNHPLNIQAKYISGEGREARGAVTMSDAMNDILQPLPPINTLSPAQQSDIQRKSEELSRYRNMITGNGCLNRYPTSIKRQIDNEMIAMLAGETDGKVRYCPPGYQFKSQGTDSSVHAGQHYFQAREVLDSSIAGAFGVPIGLIQTDKHTSKDTFQGIMKMYRDKVVGICSCLQTFMSAVFKQCINPSEVSERIVSIKPFQLDPGEIESRKLRRKKFGGGDGTDPNFLTQTLGVNTASYSIPTHSISVKGIDDKVVGVMTDKGEKRRKLDDSAIAEAQEILVPTLASDANLKAEYEMQDHQLASSLMRENVTDPAKQFSSTREEIGDIERQRQMYNKKRKRVSENEQEDEERITRQRELNFDIMKCEVRLDPLPFLIDLEWANLLLNSGVITPEYYQALVCQQAGIPDPIHPGGLAHAKRNMEYAWCISGQKNEEEAEIRKEERDFDRQVTLLKMQQEEAEKQRKADAKIRAKEMEMKQADKSTTQKSSPNKTEVKK